MGAFGRGPCQRSASLIKRWGLEAGVIESVYAMVHASIAEAAVQSFGQKVVGHGSNPGPLWWTPVMKRDVELQREVFQAWLVVA